MSKSFKNMFWMAILVVLFTLALVGCGEEELAKISLTFDDSATIVELEENGTITAPSVNLEAGEELLGWALEKDALKAKITGSSIKYDQVKSYAKDGKLALYSVVEGKIEVTMKGITDTVTKVSNLTLNTATSPLVEQNERQKFLGWALTADATEAIIKDGAVINYNSVKEYAKDAKVTLYPVVENYDLMICIHASHSNGNVYVSAEQQAEIEKILNEHFKDRNINILIDRIDGVSATNFAKAAVEKDYDLIIGSKSVVTTSDATGDIITAATLISKTYDVDAETYTTLEVVDLNQSRRVGMVTGSNMIKPYQEEAHTLLTTPVDKTIEVTFSNGTDTETITVHRTVDSEGTLIINTESYLPTSDKIIKEDDTKVFNGWALTVDATEQAFANISYSTIFSSAVDGKITVYPVYKKAPDLCVVIWGKNGSTVYVTEDEFTAIKDGFTTYLANNRVETTGKEIEIVYYVGKTAEFQSELTKTYINGALGASALSNETYAAFWTINKDYVAKSVNLVTSNASRYFGLRSGSENNELAVWFYRYATESTIEVTFDGVSETQTLSSYTANKATLPSIEEREGLTFIGFASKQDATEADIAKDVDVTYNAVEKLAENGKVTLYKVYVDSESLIDYDLIVYMLKGNSSNVYITPEEAEAAIANFKKISGNENLVIKLDYSQQGAGADFLKYVDGKGNVDVVVGASNLNPDLYSKEGFVGVLSGKVINSVFSNASRYAYIYKTCKEEHLSLAISFLKFMCDNTVEVTVNYGTTPEVTVVSALENNLVTLPEVTAESGYTFLGWAKEDKATDAIIASDVKTLDYKAVSTYATEGKLALYPVIVDSESLIQYDLYVYVLRGTAKSEYITEAEAGLFATNFLSYLAKNGDKTEYKVKVDYTQRGAGADFIAYCDGKGNADILIGASNLGCEVYENTEKGLIINGIANESRYLYIYKNCSSEHLTIAKAFYNFMCNNSVQVSVNGAESVTLTVLGKETLDLTYTPAEGKQLDGWAIASDSKEVKIAASVATIAYADVKDLAVEGIVTLYPIVSDIPSTHTCAHVCPVCGKCLDQTCTNEVCKDKCLGCSLTIAYHAYGSKETTTYITDAIKTKIETAFKTKLTNEGLDASKLNINWVAVTGKVDAADDAIQATNADIVIAHAQVFLASKCDKPIEVETGYEAVQISTTLYSDTNVKVGVVKGSGWNRLATWLYAIVRDYTE